MKNTGSKHSAKGTRKNRKYYRNYIGRDPKNNTKYRARHGIPRS